jgi:hypothetical protein
MACDSADAFAASAFAPTSDGIKSSMGADWRDHASANQNFVTSALNISQLRYYLLEQPLLVSSVSREVPNARRFQGQTCSVSCEDFKNLYIWYPDQDQSIEIRDQNSIRVFFTSWFECLSHIFKIRILLRVLSCKKNAGRTALLGKINFLR